MTNESNGQKVVPLLIGALAILAVAVAYLYKVAVFDGPENKIGYIKQDAFLSQYRPALAVQQQLQMESATAERELETRYQELQAMDADLQKKSQVLTAQALAPQVGTFQRKQNEFLQLREAHQQTLQQKQAQLLAPISQDFSNFVSKYGRDNGYLMIMGAPIEGILIYGDPAIDLTDIILAEMNAKIPPSMPVPIPSEQDTAKK